GLAVDAIHGLGESLHRIGFANPALAFFGNPRRESSSIEEGASPFLGIFRIKEARFLYSAQGFPVGRNGGDEGDGSRQRRFQRGTPEALVEGRKEKRFGLGKERAQFRAAQIPEAQDSAFAGARHGEDEWGQRGSLRARRLVGLLEER